MIHIVCPNPALDRTIHLENFHHNDVSRAKYSKDLLGGKGFNVLRSFLVHKQRPDFQVHTFLGGYTGNYLQEMIEKTGIDCNVTTIHDTTRICSAIVDEEKNHVHLINESGPIIREKEKDTFVDGLKQSVKANDYVIFSGSIPQGIEKDFYYRLIRSLENKGAKCILDTSGTFLKEGIKAEGWLIKVNKSEFLELRGHSEDCGERVVEEELQSLKTSSNIIVTLGSEGSLAKFNNQMFKITLPKIDAKNATASGDIFLGALVKNIDSDRSIEESLRMASAYSLSNCLYWNPHINLDDVKHYQSLINISKIGGQ
ncbi:1-phosphofructokinase family hexose kinase [Halobacillus litoralis]|uniref:1-phosphofructokinase family hexose kinase n=1 Tax=Halobacillus litoralis TaxID=45668 RepID=UPI001CFC78A0|nr:1-phosphofructokinase family hexose kinase [Halobacillus litoralis]WLR46618.1 1-phosphofructokinase family hexose kinase [Halobacillus litoralis]